MPSPCTVTAQFNDPTGTNLQGNAFVRFRLRNYSGFVPRVLGTAILVETQIDVAPNSSGLVTTQLWGNDNIDPGGTSNPPSTFYTVEFWNQGRITSQANYSIVGASFNLGTATQLNPPPTPPGVSGVSTLLLEVNGVKASSQAVQNLVGAAGTSIVDEGNGTIQISGGSSGIPAPDPTASFFGRTNIDLLNNGLQSGDPQVLWDAANSQWVMLWYQASGGVVSTWKATAPSLEGPWSGQTQITTLNNYHKFRILCDVNGNPVQIGGNYYGYGVFFSGTLGSKQIFLFSQSTIQGNSWAIQNSGNPVVGKTAIGGAGVYDDFSTDAPSAVYDTTSGNIYVWYMGAPGTSQADFGFATRALVAVAATVTGTYVKQAGFVLAPSAVGGTWDFGWIGGTQLRQNSAGGYFIAYNAGNTRPGSSGSEPSTSLWGFATAASLAGAWTKIPGPFIQLTGLPQWPSGVPNSGTVGTIVDTTNIWRPYCVLDPITNKWYVFYNTGNGVSPVEKVTFARQGILTFSNGAYVVGLPVITNGGVILFLTTSEQQLPGSQVFLRPGRYRVKYQVVEEDVGGTTPKLNGALFIRPNGSKAGQWSHSFFGSYAFEGDDYEVEDEIVIPAPAGGSDTSQYVDASLQIIGGTPTASTFARNLRVLVEQI
jgi:hypothetical protein